LPVERIAVELRTVYRRGNIRPRGTLEQITEFLSEQGVTGQIFDDQVDLIESAAMSLADDEVMGLVPRPDEIWSGCSQAIPANEGGTAPSVAQPASSPRSHNGRFALVAGGSGRIAARLNSPGRGVAVERSNCGAGY
jgi:hypothetical protein